MPQRQFKITVLIDSAAVPDKDPQFLKYPKNPTTEYSVIQALRNLGHTVIITPVEQSLPAVVAQLKKQKPDLVFNLTEEFRGDRRKDKVIASMLENLRIPFTGSDSKALMLCRNKILSKRILARCGINVPAHLVFPQGKKVKLSKTVKFPMVVKPAFEDGSEGISNASIVKNAKMLEQRVRFITTRWKQAAIAEQYIPGRELYVSIIGNKNPVVLPIRECIFKHKNIGPCLVTYRIKWNDKYQRKWNIKFDFAKLDKTTTKKICQTCKRAYKLLHLRDYGRIDLRLRHDNKIVLLEVNANPDIKKDEDLAQAAKRAGITYEKLLSRIIEYAIMRPR